MLNLIKIFLYKICGHKPWSRGYFTSRNKFIESCLVDFGTDVSHLPVGFGKGFDERVIEYPWFFKNLSSRQGKLLDAGSVLNFKYIIKNKKLENKQIFISTLAPEKYCFWSKGVSYLFEDIRNLSYKDNFFDEVVCISTIEHIGMNNSVYFSTEIGFVPNKTELQFDNNNDSYVQAVVEINRVLKPGGKLYLTVPFGEHKNHGWLQVFNSTMLDKIISNFGDVQEQIFIVEDNGWKLSSRNEAKQSQYYSNEDAKSGKSNNIAAAQSVACLVLTKRTISHASS